MNVVASAPGKIVLCGEYAVLWGAPAVSMAVNRRAVARVRDSGDGGCHLRTPGYEGDDGFLVIEALCDDARPAAEIELDSSAFVEGSRKIGIGSSAAVTVALAAALRNSTDIAAAAYAAHAALQHGAGSGVDVASALHGGLIEFSMPERDVRALQWPQGLAYRVLWTGVPSSTAEKLERLADQAVRASRSALLLAAPRMAAAWRRGNVEEILAEFVSYTGVLRQFSVDHDLGIFDAGHEQLTDAAMVDGLIYKPAGAGGGDVGILLGASESALDRFIEHRSGMIHGILECALDDRGVRLEAA
jgi:phosphomevalonate kinase